MANNSILGTLVAVYVAVVAANVAWYTHCFVEHGYELRPADIAAWSLAFPRGRCRRVLR